MVKIGDAVVFVNPVALRLPALVTNVFEYVPSPNPTINVVAVSEDEAEKDNYGRQTKRYTSVPHQKNSTAHGYYWREAGDESPFNPVSAGTAG
jgi:hypothetical protein